MSTTTRTVITVAAALVIPASFALAVGTQLGESKDKLQLKYDVSVYDHETGRVTVTFSLEDAGRLKPINSIDLSIPSQEKHASGGYKSDLTISMATREEGNKQVARVHIRKDWAAGGNSTENRAPGRTARTPDLVLSLNTTERAYRQSKTARAHQVKNAFRRIDRLAFGSICSEKPPILERLGRPESVVHGNHRHGKMH